MGIGTKAAGQNAHGVVLVSQSPRRKELLTCLGLEVVVFAPHTAEDALGDTFALKAMAIAKQKLAALTPELKRALPSAAMAWPHLAADTLVVLGRQCLGKPRDAEDARAMLHQLKGTSHRVVTGVALDVVGRCDCFAVTTEVIFRTLSDQAIDDYINSGEPFDKAGSYAIQGLGAHLVDEVHGSLSNVIGLPLRQTQQALASLQQTTAQKP